MRFYGGIGGWGICVGGGRCPDPAPPLRNYLFIGRYVFKKNHDSVSRVYLTILGCAYSPCICTDVHQPALLERHLSAAQKPHSAPPLTNITITAVPESGSADTRRFRSFSYLLCFSFVGAETPPRTRTGEHRGDWGDVCRCCWQPLPTEEDARVHPVRRPAVDAIDGDETEKGTCTSPRKDRKENTRHEGGNRPFYFLHISLLFPF